MKKLLIITMITITIISLTKKEVIKIPNESIRFRIVASSNNQKDQQIKKELLKKLTNSINEIEIIPNNIEETRKIIRQNIPKFEKIIEETLKDNNYNKQYKIEYGENYFPQKDYKGTTYSEGNYESLVITLGDGQGENFWCVLFPPLCLLETSDEELEEVEYTSFIKEILNKYLKK